MKSLEHLEKAEREMCASLEPRKRDADRRRAHSQEVRARAEALIRENDRLIAEYEASPAAQAKRYTEETIAAYTRTQQQSIPQDPPPYVPQGQHVTWRGQKIDLRLTWRGKKI